MALGQTQDAAIRPITRGKLADLLLLPAAVLIAVAGALLDHVTVAHRSALAHVNFGFPFGWLAQDQSSLSPHLPADITFLSPWEYPLDFRVLPLVVDMLVIYAVLLLGLFIVRAVRRRSAR